MSPPDIIVVGAGGHAAVVADAIQASGRRVRGFVDADRARHGATVLGLPVLGDDSALGPLDKAHIELANGIGGAGQPGTVGRRERVQTRLEAQGWRFATVRHPTCIVAASASVGEGAQLMSGCVVQPNARIGRGAIVNTRAVVEHDAQVGDFAHVASGAVLCGDVKVGRGCHVGAGATLRQGVVLGDHVVVGLGAAVVADARGGVLVGVPARRKEVRT